ncbi:MAG: DUF418 domain-containing protein [Bacteroidales bacterium]
METIIKTEKTPPNKRISVIDALRGFALLGVMLIHMLQHFGAFSGVRVDKSQYPILDEAIQWLSTNVIMGRFINIFALLFGLSFYIQMDRAACKGIDFRKRFLWRMLILFGIGMIGNSFFSQDILSIYAVFGVIMVFLFPLKNWTLILIASLLLLGAPRLAIMGYNKITKTEQAVEEEETRQARVTPTTFIDTAKRHLTTGLQGKLNYQFGMNGRGYITMALFILGLVIGRLQFFKDIELKQKRNAILFASFLTTTIALSYILNWIPQEPISFRMLMNPNYEVPLVAVAVSALYDLNVVAMSGTLALGFIVLYQFNPIGRYLGLITPYGRMGLTNYEMQGIVGSFLFSAWGLGAIFGTWGTTEVFVLGIAFYIIQAIISTLWLKYFLYGPLEWFWRTATYLKWQPLKKLRAHL